MNCGDLQYKVYAQLTKKLATPKQQRERQEILRYIQLSYWLYGVSCRQYVTHETFKF